MFELKEHGSAAPICVGPTGKLIKQSSLPVLRVSMMKLLYVPFGSPTLSNKSSHGSTKLPNPVVGAQTRLDFLLFLSSLQPPWDVGSCCHWSPQSSRVANRDHSSTLYQWSTACCWHHQAKGRHIFPHSGGASDAARHIWWLLCTVSGYMQQAWVGYSTAKSSGHAQKLFYSVVVENWIWKWSWRLN
jgi:hypothetical protein